MWIGLILLIAVGVGGWFLWQREAERRATAAQVVAVRTGTVTKGVVERTIRLTGVTAAEKYVSLIAPPMRGSRGSYSADRMMSGGGGTRMIRSSGSSGGSSVQSNASSSGSSGSSSVAAASSNSAAAALTGGTSGSSSGARTVRNSTSRVGGGSRGGSTTSSRSSGSTMGSSGMGSTASALVGGGGGGFSSGGMGRGGDDFMMVLQELIKPGSLVKKGETVAEFDRQYMINRVDDYRAAVVQTEASFRKEQAEVDVSLKAHEQTIAVAQADVEKARLDMKTIPVRSAIESERFRLAQEEAEARYKQLLTEVKFVDIGAKAQLRSASIDLQQTKLELKRVEAHAEKLIVKAPIDGLTVMQTTFRGAEFGQIQQGDQLYPGQLYMQVVDISTMVINASLNQVDVESLRIGQRAKIRVDAFPDLELPGRVMSIGAMTKSGGFRASYVKEIPVRIRMERMDPRVIPDLSVSVEVTIESEAQESAVVPLEAVFADGPGDKPYVLVQSGDGWARRDVELGICNHLRAAVRSGVKAGEVIALERPPAQREARAATPAT